jgi:hypothetical protein
VEDNWIEIVVDPGLINVISATIHLRMGKEEEKKGEKKGEKIGEKEMEKEEVKQKLTHSQKKRNRF